MAPRDSPHSAPAEVPEARGMIDHAGTARQHELGDDQSITIPRSDEAERGVLGGVILSNDQLDAATAELIADDFSDSRHPLIFRAFLRLRARGMAIDLITLRDDLEHRGEVELNDGTREDELQRAGGIGYLVSLVDGTARSANVEHYARIVKAKARRRQIMRETENLYRAAGNCATDDQVERAYELLRHALDDGARAPALTFETGVEVLSRPAKSRPVAVDPILGEREILILSGPVGVGKSTLMLDFSVSLATGAPVFGLWPVSRPYVVAIADLEDGVDNLARRLHTSYAVRDLSRLLILRERIRFDDGESVRRLLRFVEANRVDFLLVDSFRRAYVGEENSSGVLSAVFVGALDPLKSAGCGSLLIDHPRKLSGDKALDSPEEMLRGSSDKRALCDVHVGLEKRDAGLAWIPTKTRGSMLPEPVLLVVSRLDGDDGPVTIDVLGNVDRTSDKIQDAVLVLLTGRPEGIQRGEIIGRSGYSERAVDLALSALKKRGRVDGRKDGKRMVYTATSEVRPHDRTTTASLFEGSK